MSKTLSLAQKHWVRILRRWPEDRMRPKFVAVQTVMQKRLTDHMKPQTPSEAAESVKSNEALVTPIQPLKWDETKELAQANALYSLLEERYMKEYPMPETLRYPQSRPTHYDDILREFEEAPDRTWWQRLLLKFQGSVRLQ